MILNSVYQITTAFHFGFLIVDFGFNVRALPALI
jgi:hypothetical protein